MADPGTSLVQLLRQSGAVDVIADAIDSTSEVLFEGELAEAIPVAGAVLKFVKAYSKVRDVLFMKKVLKFISETRSTTQHERDIFYEELIRNDRMQEFGETVLLIVEKSDHMEKAAIAGRMMAAHMSGHTDYHTALRICNMVNLCYIGDLELLKSLPDPLPDDIQVRAPSILFTGLAASQAMLDGGDYSRGDEQFFGPTYGLSSFGQLLKKYGL